MAATAVERNAHPSSSTASPIRNLLLVVASEETVVEIQRLKMPRHMLRSGLPPFLVIIAPNLVSCGNIDVTSAVLQLMWKYYSGVTAFASDQTISNSTIN